MGDSDKHLESMAKNAPDDFYELLGVAFDASESAITKAYRKASIKYHPDKNPDNKEAADRFIYLGWARDILIDPKLKGEYDRARTRRREKALQDELLDGRRRDMIRNLEKQEAAGTDPSQTMKRKRPDEYNEAEQKEALVQRLAADSKRRRTELQERREKERRQQEEVEEAAAAAPPPQPSQPGAASDLDRSIKIRFQRDGPTQDWDKDTLQNMFAKYGKIDSIVMGKEKKIRPSGLDKHRKIFATVFIVYTRLHAAHAAVSDAKSDYSLLENVAWVNGEPDTNLKSPPAPSTPVSTPRKDFRASFGASGLGKSVGGGGGTPGAPKFSFSPKTPNLHEVTMIRLREAEKKRLEEQIRKREAAEEAGS